MRINYFRSFIIFMKNNKTLEFTLNITLNDQATYFKKITNKKYLVQMYSGKKEQ